MSADARDLIGAALGLAMVSGVYLDGWAHVTRPAFETFFTPWHGVLYSAFTLLAGFLVAVSVRRRGGRLPWRLAPPPGYRQGLAGVVVFAAGGVGDLVWHKVFSIETGIDALLSPTHLVLLTGGMLMVATALRSAASTGAAGAAVVVSVATVGALAGFFLSYVSVFADPGAVGTLTTLPEGAPGHREAELPAVAGLGSYLLSTAVIMLPLLATRRMGVRLPAGGATAVVAAVALLGSLLSDLRYLAAAVAAVVGAAAAEAVTRRWSARYNRWTVLGVLLPLAVWAGQLAGLAFSRGVGWPVDLWAGVILLTALVGWALAWVSQRGTGLTDKDDNLEPLDPDNMQATGAA